MNAKKHEPVRSLGLWVVLLLSVFAWAPATYPGYWESLVGFAPLFNAQYPSPIADIATVADVWRGTGGAAFILAQPLTRLGLSPAASVRTVFILSLMMGCVSVYVWLRPRFGDRAAGLAGLLYGLMPPLLTTIYVRGSLADALVLGLLPLVLAGLTIYRLARNPASIGVSVVGLLWIWRTQAGLAIFVSLLLLLYALIVERDRLAGLAVFVASVAGLLSLVSLWGIQGPAPAPFAQHFLNLYQLLAGAGATPVFLLGFVPVGFSLVAVWLLWMRPRLAQPEEQAPAPLYLLDQDRLLRFSFVVWIVACVLSLGVSAPLWQLTRAGRLLTYPWQILLPALPFLAATAGSLPLLSRPLARVPYWAVLLALVILGSLPHLDPSFTRYQPPALPEAVYGEHGELLLLQADIEEDSLSDQHGRARLSVVWQPLQPFAFDYNVFFQALRPDRAGEGYEVIAQLDQQPLPDRPATTWQPGEILTATYQLELPVDPNEITLRYYYGYYDWRNGARLPIDGGVDDKTVLYGE